MRSRLAIVLVIICLDTAGFGIVFPVLPRLITTLSPGDLTDAARISGWLAFIYGASQAICAPILGRLSDRFGRRPILVVSLFAVAVEYGVMTWAPTLSWLFLGRLLTGVFSGNIAAAQAYIADISSPQERPRFFGLAGAAGGVGFIGGPLIAAILQPYHPRAPFVVAAAVATIAAVCAWFALNESLPQEQRRLLSWNQRNFGVTFQKIRRPRVVLLLAAAFVFLVAFHGVPAIWVYYTIQRFNWTTAQTAYSIAFAGVVMVLAQSTLLARIVKYVDDNRATQLGLILSLIGYFGYAVSAQVWLLYTFIVPAASGCLAIPTFRALVSSVADATDQGEFQGIFAALSSVAQTIGPLIFTHLFVRQSTRPSWVSSGRPFLAAGAFALASLALLKFSTVGEGQRRRAILNSVPVLVQREMEKRRSPLV